MSSTLAETARGEATVLDAVRVFTSQELPRFPVAFEEVSSRQAGERREAGLYAYSERSGEEVIVGIREAGRLAEALQVVSINGGWIVSGDQVCSSLLTRSIG